MGRERVREGGLEQRRGAASSLAKPGDLGVRWSGGSKPVTPSLSSPAYSPQGRRWPREACPASVICLSVVHLQQSACSGFAILGARFIRGLGSPGKKKSSLPETHRVKNFSLFSPRTWGLRTAPQRPGWWEPRACSLKGSAPGLPSLLPSALQSDN